MINEPKKKAFLYCRTSVDSEEDDGKKVSIEEQTESGRALAVKNGYEVIGEFIDRNRSSKIYPTGFEIPDFEVEQYCDECKLSPSHRTRDAFGKMMERLPEVQIVIVRAADRLMRALPLSKLDAHILSYFKRHKVLIHSHDNNILDPHNNQHILLFKIQSGISSSDTEKRREETRKAIRMQRDHGKLYFCPTFLGFKSIGLQQVERIPAEVEMVKQIFKEFLETENIDGIARRLNREGIPTRPSHGQHKKGEKGKTGRPWWTGATIRHILQRPQYAGFQYKSNGIDEVPTPLFHPPVINRDTFKRVQTILDNRKKFPRKFQRNSHVISGLARCGNCGYNLYSTATYVKYEGQKVKVDYFRCNKFRQTGGATGCGEVSIRERFPRGIPKEKGEFYVHGLEECIFPLIYKGYINHLANQKRRAGLTEDIAKHEQEIAKVNEFKTKLGKKLADGIIDDKTFDTMVADYVRKGKELDEQLERLKKEANVFDLIEVPPDIFENYQNHDIPGDIKRQLLISVIHHVDVWQDRITVYLKPDDKDRQFTLRRIKVKNSWVLPGWKVIEVNANGHDTIQREDGLQEVRIRKTPITEKTQFDILYIYDSNDDLEPIYSGDNLLIFSVGRFNQNWKVDGLTVNESANLENG